MTRCQPWRVGQVPGANIFAPLVANGVTLIELLTTNGYEIWVAGRLDMVTTEKCHTPLP